MKSVKKTKLNRGYTEVQFRILYYTDQYDAFDIFSKRYLLDKINHVH